MGGGVARFDKSSLLPLLEPLSRFDDDLLKNFFDDFDDFGLPDAEPGACGSWALLRALPGLESDFSSLTGLVAPPLGNAPLPVLSLEPKNLNLSNMEFLLLGATILRPPTVVDDDVDVE